MSHDVNGIEKRKPAASTEPAQRRKHVRYAVELPCRLIGERFGGRGAITDLSFGGCRVETDAAMTPGEYLRLEMDSVVRSHPLVVDLAVVRWAGRKVSGLEIIRIEPVQQERMRLLLRYIEHDHALGAVTDSAAHGGSAA